MTKTIVKSNIQQNFNLVCKYFGRYFDRDGKLF